MPFSNRRSTRLPCHDYCGTSAVGDDSAQANERSGLPYFITLCTHERVPLFGSVAAGNMRLSQIGEIVQDEWRRTAFIRREVQLDQFVLMPDHFHAIVWLLPAMGVGAAVQQGNEYARLSPSRRGVLLPRSLGALVAGFKAATTHRIRSEVAMASVRVWQRGYHDRVIRTALELERARHYVATNPARWTR